METNQHLKNLPKRAFTIMEVLVALGVSALLFVSLYAGFSSGWMVTEVARENLRATQIMVEKMETIRLYSWSQVTAPTNFIPRTFEDTYYPNSTNPSMRGLTYTGLVTISTVTNLGTYGNNMRLMKIDLNWTSGGIRRSRSMETLVSRYGLQNYVY